MKKIIALIVFALVSVSIVGCAKSNDTGTVTLHLKKSNS
jgi:hypothetical protein